MDNTKKETELYCESLHIKLSEELGTDKFFIAGGAIRWFVENSQVKENDFFSSSVVPLNDIDVFITDPTIWQDAKDKLMESGYIINKERKSSVVFEKAGKKDINLVLLKNIVVSMQIIEGFDFTNSQAVYGNNELKTSDTFFEDVLDKELKINEIKLPYHSIQRAAKFQKNGYTVSDDVKITLINNALNSTHGFKQEEEYIEL